MCLQRYKDFFEISIGDITARKKCRRYDKDKWWDGFGKVIGESLGKAIGDNVREKAGKIT
jgi:hypothetical protein